MISGSARGRRLLTPKTIRIRPTSDRVKEAIFNVLGNRIDYDGSRVLDIFAGTGNLGIEALSRGASSAVFIENHRDSLALITKNLEITGFSGSSRIIAKDALASLKVLSQEQRRFDLVLLDPPYEQGMTERTLQLLGSSTLVDDRTIVVAEFSIRDSIASTYSNLTETDRRAYGDTVVSLFTYAAMETVP